MVRSGQDLSGAGQLPPELRHRSGRNPENDMTLSRLANFHFTANLDDLRD